VRKEDYPFVADEVMEVDRALSGFCVEVRGDAAQARNGGGRSLVEPIV